MKSFALLTAALLSITSQGTVLNKNENNSILAIADSLGAKTDLLNIPNYYHDDERPVRKESYDEWLSKTTNVECGLSPAKTFNDVVNRGNCFGITLVEVLCHNGIFSPSEVQKSANNLSDVVYDDNINKLLTDYQALQVHTEYELFDHYLRTNLSFEEQVDRVLKIAEESMLRERYFVIYFQTHSLSHAVTGMGVADGLWQFGDSTYDKCILTHDSNGTDSDGNTGFNENGCIYVNSETHHVYIPAYEIDSDDEMIIGAINDDTLLNYKGSISPSQSIETDLTGIKKVTFNFADDINYEISFIENGTAVPLGDYLTSFNTRIYYTLADKIVSKSSKTNNLDTTNDFTIQDVESKKCIATFEQLSEVILEDDVCSIQSTNDEKLRFNVQYYLNTVPENTDQSLFSIYGYSSNIDIVQKTNGFLLKGDINGKYGFTTMGLKIDEDGRKEGGYGNQYVYEFKTVQDVLIAYDDQGNLGLYVDSDRDGTFSDKVKMGDTNCDGRIDAVDASEILSKYSEISTSPDIYAVLPEYKGFLEWNYINYDFNDDGKIDARDATSVLIEYSRLSTM